MTFSPQQQVIPKMKKLTTTIKDDKYTSNQIYTVTRSISENQSSSLEVKIGHLRNRFVHVVIWALRLLTTEKVDRIGF